MVHSEREKERPQMHRLPGFENLRRLLRQLFPQLPSPRLRKPDGGIISQYVGKLRLFFRAQLLFSRS